MRGIVLVVDDHVRPRKALATELEDAGFAVVQAGNGEDGWRMFQRHRPDVVITDMVMPRSDGLELLGRIRLRSDAPVILFTARGSVATAAAAFKAGADDFVASPDVDVDDLVELVANACGEARATVPAPDLAGRLVGASRAMVRIRERVLGLAPLRTPVLVSGEPGTGRDAIVEALHRFGSTGSGELVRIDPANFEPGDRLPDAAAFHLDGIERLPATAQLHWSNRIRSAEADDFRIGPRVFASTAEPRPFGHNDGEYQELRSTLVRFSIELPPLRAISDDIPAIADALVDRIGSSVGRNIRLSPSAREYLAAQHWPGNVRQLEQLLERAIAFSRGRQIRRDVVREILAELEESLASIRDQHRALERDALLRAIQETGGNVSRTADRLGRSRSAVYRLIEKHGIRLSRDS